MESAGLFDLAQRTGFDLESLIFCFAIGGVGVVLYDLITGAALKPVGPCERTGHRHRYHRTALLAPVAAFAILYVLPWNPIYPAILALLIGGIATVACRSDLQLKTMVGGSLFAGCYAVFMVLLEWSATGYIELGFAFGTYWSGIYEHLMWQRVVTTERAAATGHGYA